MRVSGKISFSLPASPSLQPLSYLSYHATYNEEDINRIGSKKAEYRHPRNNATWDKQAHKQRKITKTVQTRQTTNLNKTSTWAKLRKTFIFLQFHLEFFIQLKNQVLQRKWNVFAILNIFP